MKFNKNQIVDLSNPILIGQEGYGYSIKTRPVYPGSMSVGEWYIGSDITIGSHVGTHIETPFHHSCQGKDCQKIPVHCMVGEAIVINVTGKENQDPITLEDVKKAEDQIQDGDMIFLYTGFDQYYRGPRWREYPYITPEALEWMLQYHPKAIGTDAFGVEIPGAGPDDPIHNACFENDVIIIEHLSNLKAIDGLRTTAFILALPLQGSDASPTRIIAIKDIADTVEPKSFLEIAREADARFRKAEAGED